MVLLWYRKESYWADAATGGMAIVGRFRFAAFTTLGFAFLRDFMSILNVAAYHFHPLDQLQDRRVELREICFELGLKGTILLSREGVNLFIAGARDGVERVLGVIRSFPGFSGILVKESETEYQPFNRMLVKIKKEIIPVGCTGIDPDPVASPKLAPRELKQWLDEGRPVALLDTRNDYEVALGTFEGAIDLQLKTFREFPSAAAALPEEVRKQPVVMFCTGGIRCEKIGPYMKGLGFENIYQLEGGILKYFEECAQDHYQGECFVFDQRVAVDPSLAPTDVYECFACKHVLTVEDCSSPKYREGVSCPHCYKDPEKSQEDRRQARQLKIQSIARTQPGCTPYENRRWISIPQQCAGMRLIDALHTFYPPYTTEQWLDAIRTGEITSPASTKSHWQTQSVVADQQVREGERFLHAIQGYSEPAIDPEIELLYEDEAIVVVHKGAPLPLHPSGRFHKNSLEWILHEAYFPEKLRPAHRIDSMTTGLVVFTRKYKFASALQPQFASGEVIKTYLAWIHGVPSWEQTSCDLPISDVTLQNGRRQIDPNGQSAETFFRVVRKEPNRTLVQIEPKTGRTHQIRLHLAALGHPIEGDQLYGDLSIREPSLSAEVSQNKDVLPMLLHAWCLGFLHPLTGQRVEFQADRQEFSGS